MQPSRPTPSRKAFRTLAVAALVAALVATAGCSWFRKDNKLYAQSPETRPLEVPPDLDRPDTSGAMKVPEAGGSVTRSTMPAPQAGPDASNTGFNVATDRDQVFEQVGTLLAGTAGVTVVSKAQLLGTYDVDYEGAKFLVRVTKTDAGTYVSAVDPRGLPASDEAPVKLIAALKAGLGG
jgi:uncharacterized lipoprotein